MLPTEMGQPHKHTGKRSILKTLDKHGCYIKIPLTLVEKLVGTTDVVEPKSLKALGGKSDTNKHNMPLQTHHRELNCLRF